MRSVFIERTTPFTADMMTESWGFRAHQMPGDHITGFVGPDSTGVNDATKPIPNTDLQLHFLVEHFNVTRSEAVHRMYLLLHILKDLVDPAFDIKNGLLVLGNMVLTTRHFRCGSGSTSFHVGLFIDPEHPTKPSIGLDDLDVPCRPMAYDLMHAYMHDIGEILAASIAEHIPQGLPV
jgi:hypothetical protein